MKNFEHVPEACFQVWWRELPRRAQEGVQYCIRVADIQYSESCNWPRATSGELRHPLLTIDRNALPSLLEQQGYGEAVIELANMPMHAALPLRPPMDVDMYRQLNPDDLQHPDGERFARITHSKEFRQSLWTPTWTQPDAIWRVKTEVSAEPALRARHPVVPPR